MSLYSLLEVDENATNDEIKKSFRRLSMRYHPDRPDGDSSKYKEINNAYNILSDDDKRREYNMKKRMDSMEDVDLFSMLFGNKGNSNPMKRQQFQPTFDEEPEISGAGIPFIFESLFHGMGDGNPNIRIFRNGQPVYSNRIEKPEPIHTTCEITLEESYFGTSKHIEIQRWVIKNDIKYEEFETVYVDIPKGMDTNEMVILENKGHIKNDVVKGDVKVCIQIKEHPIFKRDGLDLYFTKSLTFKESLCGFQFTLPYIDGKHYSINSEAGKVVYPDFKKSIQNMGMHRNDKKGSLIIKFSIQYPESIPKHVITYLSENL